MGDQVRLAPEVGLEVALVEPGHALVLQGGVAMGSISPPYDFTWAFVLQEAPDGTTRLLVRERYRYTRWWAPLLVEPAEIISFVMSQRMLRGISDRAERQTAPYFDATPDSSDEALAAEVARHPVFRLVPEAAGDS